MSVSRAAEEAKSVCDGKSGESRKTGVHDMPRWGSKPGTNRAVRAGISGVNSSWRQVINLVKGASKQRLPAREDAGLHGGRSASENTADQSRNCQNPNTKGAGNSGWLARASKGKRRGLCATQKHTKRAMANFAKTLTCFAE